MNWLADKKLWTMFLLAIAVSLVAMTTGCDCGDDDDDCAKFEKLWCEKMVECQPQAAAWMGMPADKGDCGDYAEKACELTAEDEGDDDSGNDDSCEGEMPSQDLQDECYDNIKDASCEELEEAMTTGACQKIDEMSSCDDDYSDDDSFPADDDTYPTGDDDTYPTGDDDTYPVGDDDVTPTDDDATPADDDVAVDPAVCTALAEAICPKLVECRGSPAAVENACIVGFEANCSSLAVSASGADAEQCADSISALECGGEEMTAFSAAAGTAFDDRDWEALVTAAGDFVQDVCGL